MTFILELYMHYAHIFDTYEAGVVENGKIVMCVNSKYENIAR